jgi:putative ABC transport system permease protein
MTSLNGLNGGMQNFIKNELGALNANLLTVTPSPVIMGEFGGGSEQSAVTLNEQTVKMLKAVSGVDKVVSFYAAKARIVSGGVSRDITITGIDQSKLQAIYPKLSMEAGSLLQVTDSIGIVLGNEVAHPPGRTAPFASVRQTVSLEFAFIQDTPQGQKTQTKTRIFQVKGILNSMGTAGVDSAAFITPSPANALFEKGGRYFGIYVLTKNSEINDEVENKIKKIYTDKIGVVSPKTTAATVQRLLGSFTGFITSVAAISMLVGGVGIVTTLYTSVMERTREIGLLKALGFRNEVVTLIFLSESALIGFIGASIGILTGIGGAQILTRTMSFGPGAGTLKPVIVPSDLGTVFLLSLLLSTIAGLYPAWRAASLDPIVALRKE